MKIDPETKRSISLTNRWNNKELQDLKELKALLGIAVDGKAIKLGVKIAKNVLQNVFGSKLLVMVTTKPEAYNKEVKKILEQKR